MFKANIKYKSLILMTIASVVMGTVAKAESGPIPSALTPYFQDESNFSGKFFYLEGVLKDIFEINSQNVGWIVHGSKIDDPDFYSPNIGIGKKIRAIYGELSERRHIPEEELPESLMPVLDIVEDYIQEHSETEDKRSQFYSGPNGNENGKGFTFSREDLPLKIVKLSYCFGFDPLVFTGLIKQESHFYRYAKSPTQAVGFTQLTSSAYMEISEQLGILDSETKYPLHGKDSPEIFKSYFQCYLGPNKEWRNIWEDSTSGVPSGKKAYRNEFIGSGRIWKYQSKTRRWLNEDPDRNLLYGAALFKLYLGKFGGYPKALKKYNISHSSTYFKKISRNYRQLHRDYEEKIAQNPDLFEPPVAVAKQEQGDSQREDKLLVYAFNYRGKKCLTDAEKLYEETGAMFLIKDFFVDSDMLSSTYKNLSEGALCLREGYSI